jgi:adenylate cyclase
MNKIIIAILKNIKLDNTLDSILKEKDIALNISNSVEEAEKALFEQTPIGIITEWEIPDIETFVHNLKSDEMFKNLPILAITPFESSKSAFEAGVDSCVHENAVETIPMYLKPLICLSVENQNLLQRVSELQEKSIKDFILLDLIKKYIPKTIMDIAEEYAVQQKLEIPKKEMELTIVLADIKEFTRMSHRLKPAQVIDNLNAAFAIVTRITYEEGGDIDKFIGDAFLAVFDDPMKSIHAMYRIQSEIAELNETRKEQKLDPIEFRIGINTGPIIRGNVGGNNRYDNTLIGDTVNAASRLQEAAPPGGITISENTRKRADLFLPEEYKRTINMKGREGEELIWDIYDYIKENT